MSASNFKVLVVDDEDEIAELCAETFEEFDFQVRTAKNGIEALEVLKEYQADIVVSDANMPKMGGLELLKSIIETIERPPLFYLATGSLAASEQELIDLGGKRLISKPYDLEECVEVVKKDLGI